MTTRPSAVTVHLVRHGEVDNPMNVIYGRLPGYHLSDRGRRQAKETSEYLADRNLVAIWASPLERAQETARAIAEPHGLEVVTDDRLIESDTTLQGIGRSLRAFARSPKHWWSLHNPLRPSWGEPYAAIRARMLEAIADAAKEADGGEVALVAHQSPVREAFRALIGRRLPTASGMTTPCHTGSVTTVVLDDDGRVVDRAYFRPSA